MSINDSGIKSKVESDFVTILVRDSHPLIKLGQILPWQELYEIVLPDLKASTHKGCWWLGRKLMVRIHLGAYIIQTLYNKTDRQTEYDIKDNAAYQLFCGSCIVEGFHFPDHTKLAEFRNRLSAETHNKLANFTSKFAVKMGYASASSMDIDSTIQKANMAYPSDVNLLVKLSKKAVKVWQEMQDKVSHFLLYAPKLDIVKIKSLARTCFFSNKKPCSRTSNLSKLWHTVYNGVYEVMKLSKCLTQVDIAKFSWDFKRALSQLQEHGRKYLFDVVHYVSKGKISKGKTLSFHLDKISCFVKAQATKKTLQFGRRIQLARIGGNFCLIQESGDNVRMEDKTSLESMVKLHGELFGASTLESITADKGYYSKANKIFLINKDIAEIGLQQPGCKGSLPADIKEDLRTKLVNRRAGIEPLIGHMKHGWQLGKSRMKSDKATLSAAYGSVFAFNLRQIIRNLQGKVEPLVT